MIPRALRTLLQGSVVTKPNLRGVKVKTCYDGETPALVQPGGTSRLVLPWPVCSAILVKRLNVTTRWKYSAVTKATLSEDYACIYAIVFSDRSRRLVTTISFRNFTICTFISWNWLDELISEIRESEWWRVLFHVI